MKSSQTTLIPPEGHCQNNKQLGFFKESYLSWTGEGCVRVCFVCVYPLFLRVCVCVTTLTREFPAYWFFSHPNLNVLRTSSLLFRADPLGRRQPHQSIVLPAGGHLDAHLHRNGPSTQLQRPGPGRDSDARDPASLPGFGEGPRSAPGAPAQASLVLDENQDIAQREVGLALTTGQQVMLPGSHPPRAGCGWLRGRRSRPRIMIGLCCGGKKRENMRMRNVN